MKQNLVSFVQRYREADPEGRLIPDDADVRVKLKAIRRALSNETVKVGLRYPSTSTRELRDA